MSDFTFQGQGTLKRIDTFTTKGGKNVLTLVIEVGGQYPQMIPIKVFNRLADEAASWAPGSILAIKGRLGGREWQDRVFGDMVATEVEVLERATGRAETSQPKPADDDVPF